MHLHAAQTQEVDDAAAQPLVGSHAEDVVAAGVEVRLQTGQQAAGKQVAVPPVAVACLLLSSDELLSPAHVQVLTCAEVSHQLRKMIRLHVSVVLGQEEPVVVRAVVLMQVAHRLVHQPHRPVVAVGDHRHAVRHFGAAQPREEEGAVESVGGCSVHRHGERAEGGPRGQNADQQSLSDAQLGVDVSCPGQVERNQNVSDKTSCTVGRR